MFQGQVLFPVKIALGVKIKAADASKDISPEPVPHPADGAGLVAVLRPDLPVGVKEPFPLHGGFKDRGSEGNVAVVAERFLGVPVINIGSRQNKRERGLNVHDVGYDRNEILATIDKIKSSSRPQSSNVYGGGDAGLKIANHLAEVPLIFHKTITF